MRDMANVTCAPAGRPCPAGKVSRLMPAKFEPKSKTQPVEPTSLAATALSVTAGKMATTRSAGAVHEPPGTQAGGRRVSSSASLWRTCMAPGPRAGRSRNGPTDASFSRRPTLRAVPHGCTWIQGAGGMYMLTQVGRQGAQCHRLLRVGVQHRHAVWVAGGGRHGMRWVPCRWAADVGKCTVVLPVEKVVPGHRPLGHGPVCPHPRNTATRKHAHIHERARM